MSFAAFLGSGFAFSFDTTGAFVSLEILAVFGVFALLLLLLSLSLCLDFPMGFTVGFAVGFALGLPVGLAVGRAVGRTLGREVGLAVAGDSVNPLLDSPELVADARFKAAEPNWLASKRKAVTKLPSLNALVMAVLSSEFATTGSADLGL